MFLVYVLLAHTRSLILRFMCFLRPPSHAPLHNVTGLLVEIANQTFHTWSQWSLARQVGTCGRYRGNLICGFRLHKHHYHLSDLELLRCSAATPILSGALNGDVCRLPGTWAIESTKRNLCSVWHVGMCVVCASEKVYTYVRVLTQ